MRSRLVSLLLSSYLCPCLRCDRPLTVCAAPARVTTATTATTATTTTNYRQYSTVEFIGKIPQRIPSLRPNQKSYL